MCRRQSERHKLLLGSSICDLKLVIFDTSIAEFIELLSVKFTKSLNVKKFQESLGFSNEISLSNSAGSSWLMRKDLSDIQDNY